MGKQLMAGLRSALEAEGVGEYLALLESDGAGLAAAGREGTKALQEHLKAAGVAKMGQRQKIAKAVKAALEEEEEEEEEEEAGSSKRSSDDVLAEPSGETGSSFWASMVSANDDLTSAGDLGAVQLDASLYSAPVRVLPRAADQGAPTPPPVAPVDVVHLEKREAGDAYGGAGGGGGSSVGGQLGAYRERGNVAYARQDYAAAETWYEKVLAVPADDGAGGMNLDHAAALSNLAACALARQPPEPAAAMRRLAPLLSACPRHVRGRLRAGRCCVMLGELRAALTHYEVAFDVEKPKTPKDGLKLRWAPPTADVDPERRKLLGPDGAWVGVGVGGHAGACGRVWARVGICGHVGVRTRGRGGTWARGRVGACAQLPPIHLLIPASYPRLHAFTPRSHRVPTAQARPRSARPRSSPPMASSTSSGCSLIRSGAAPSHLRGARTRRSTSPALSNGRAPTRRSARASSCAAALLLAACHIRNISSSSRLHALLSRSHRPTAAPEPLPAPPFTAAHRRPAACASTCHVYLPRLPATSTCHAPVTPGRGFTPPGLWFTPPGLWFHTPLPLGLLPPSSTRPPFTPALHSHPAAPGPPPTLVHPPSARPPPRRRCASSRPTDGCGRRSWRRRRPSTSAQMTRGWGSASRACSPDAARCAPRRGPSAALMCVCV